MDPLAIVENVAEKVLRTEAAVRIEHYQSLNLESKT